MGLLIALSVLTQAQTTAETAVKPTIDPSPRWVVKTDALRAILSNPRKGKFFYTLAGEYCFRGKNSIQLTIMPYIDKQSYSYPNDMKGGQHIKELQLMPMYKRFFGNKHAYSGVYMGVNGFVSKGNNTRLSINTPLNYYYKYRTTSLGGALNIGYQRYIKEHIVIDVMMGAGAHKIFTNLTGTNNNILNRKYSTADLNANWAINIGYRF